MKKLLFILSFILYPLSFCLADTRTQVATDTFTYSNGDLATVSSSAWAQRNTNWGNIIVTTNKFSGNSANPWNQGGGPPSAVRTSGTYTDDNYSKLVVSGLQNLVSESYNVGVCVRMSGGDTALSAYCFLVDGLNGSPYHMRLYKINTGGTPVSITTGTAAWVDGDTISLEVRGAVVTAFRNDVAIGGAFTHTCASACPASTGSTRPGVVSGGSSTGLIGDNWEGGSVTAGGAPPPGNATVRRRIQ